ncbi:hypothetical protein AB1K54_06255 [Microbacterium sp. BWT-B31]|uniref:hypothetical protein n=1 Tax=Microbacterium sp. BWT-B31 TaxID=3232072 RepID=UPI003526EA29
MTAHATHDPFAGTPYRLLLDASDALDLARYHGSGPDSIGYDPRAAVAAIDDTLAALAAARAILEGEAA